MDDICKTCGRPRSQSKAWSPKEKKKLKQLVDENKPLDEIYNEFPNRPERQIKKYIYDNHKKKWTEDDHTKVREAIEDGYTMGDLYGLYPYVPRKKVDKFVRGNEEKLGLPLTENNKEVIRKGRDAWLTFEKIAEDHPHLNTFQVKNYIDKRNAELQAFIADDDEDLEMYAAISG